MKLRGYAIFVVVLLISTLVTAMLGMLSPWVSTAVALLSVLSAVAYLDALSILAVGILVALVTAVFPISLLFAIGASYKMSPLPYLKGGELLWLALPTVAAMLFMLVLRGIRKTERT